MKNELIDKSLEEVTGGDSLRQEEKPISFIGSFPSPEVDTIDNINEKARLRLKDES